MTARWRNDIVGHFVRSDTSHVMQAIDVTRHSRIAHQLVPSTTALSFICCSQFACKKSCSWLSVWPSYIFSMCALLFPLGLKFMNNFKNNVLQSMATEVRLCLSILQFILLYCNAVAGIWGKFAVCFCVIAALWSYSVLMAW